MRKAFCLFSLLVFSFSFAPKAFSQDESDDDNTDALPYEENEFPQWAKDLRRYEIVSLGSVPFTAFTITLGYGLVEYLSGATSSFPNPFDKGSAFSQNEQIGILCASIGAGLLIGFVDLGINLGKRHREKKKLERIKAAEDQIVVLPFNDEEETEENQEEEKSGEE